MLWSKNTTSVDTAIDNFHKNTSSLEIRTEYTVHGITWAGNQPIAQLEGLWQPMGIVTCGTSYGTNGLGIVLHQFELQGSRIRRLSDDGGQVACFTSNPKL